MLRKIFFGSLVILAVACNKEQVINPAESSYPEGSTKPGNKNGLQAIQRGLPEGGLKASASGPAAHSQGSRIAMEPATGASSALISFEPNAGTIWKDPVTNATHLLALQLPNQMGIHVKWASLGTGWEGAEMMTMDKDNFYIVWRNSVFMVPKKEKNIWYLLIGNNGEDIKGIAGSKTGGYLARGNTLYYFSPNGIKPLYTKPGIIEYTRFMAGYYRADGSSTVHFLTTNNNFVHTFNDRPEQITWSISGFDYMHVNSKQNMTANPVTKYIYLSYISPVTNKPSVQHASVVMGNATPFSSQSFSSGAPLVTNNGFVWIMGSTFYKLRTLGSLAGTAEHAEYGWDGVLLGCADPGLVF